MNTTTLSPFNLAKHGEPSMQASATGFRCLKWTSGWIDAKVQVSLSLHVLYLGVTKIQLSLMLHVLVLRVTKIQALLIFHALVPGGNHGG